MKSLVVILLVGFGSWYFKPIQLSALAWCSLTGLGSTDADY
jgi:hypothetical protein